MCKIYALRMKGKLGALMAAIVFLGMGNIALAQTAANYAFTTNATSSLTQSLAGTIDMSSGTTQAVGPGLDASQMTATNIGFDFFFLGTRYTQFSVNEDGQVRFSSNAGTNNYSLSSGTAAAPKLAAFNTDMRTGATTGKIHYKIFGTAPNRVLVIEFKEMQLFYTSSAAAGTSTFQVRLYETTGIVEYVYGTMSATDVSTGNKAPSIGFYAGASNFASVTYATHTVTTTGTYTANPDVTVVGPINELTSSSDGSRRKYGFTPPAVAAPTGLNFTAAAASSMTLNWTEPSPATGILKYAIYNSTDGITYNFVNTVNVGTATYSASGLSLNTNYFWRVYAVSEGALSTALAGSQSTTGPLTYYWTGTGGADFNANANWNTNPNGTGNARTAADATDMLVIDGDGTTAGAATTINVSANASIGLFRITNNTAVTLQSSSTTTRTLTITGGTGDDLDITAGSSLSMNNANNAVAFAFSGNNNTGNIAGTVTLGGGTGNKITTTGGTGTVVTVQGTGVVNSTAASSTALLVGSTATLSFAAGSNFNVSGYTTSDTYIPTATWDANSNITLTGGTTGTGLSTSSTSLGNFTYNSATQTATLSAFTSNTITIKGNMTIQSTNTGTFRALTSGTLTVLGNLVINGGTLEVASAAGTLKLAGNLVQAGGTLNASGTTNSLEFNGTTAQSATTGTMGTGALNVRINNAAGVNLTGNLLINDGATLTVSNGNITGTGTVTYGATSGKLAYNGTTGAQTANAIEFPATNGPAGLTINNTATAPNNVVNIPFTRTLGTGGVLAMTAGILNNAGNAISVTNTATGGITGGSATAYIKGTLNRNLPASLATGSTYLFPIGKGTYNQMELVNPVTNAGGTVTVSAEAFDASAGGSAGTSISAINSNRYWAISTTNGAANLTSTNMRLYDAPGLADAIAGSSTLTGAYGLVGGATPTVTSTSITTTNPGLSGLVGYYVMGTRAAATISNLAISPTGNQCTNVVRTVTVTVTPGGAPITGVVINYSVNGTAQAAVAMTNTSGNNWSGTIPTVTPANATVSWSVTATDANTLTKTQAGTDYNDNPFFGANALLTASQTSLCAGNATTLSAVLATPGDAPSIGTATTLTGDNDDVTAFGNRWPTFHMQILYTAADLAGAGLSAGQISAITFKVNTIGSSASNTNYTVMMGATNATSLTGYVSTAAFTPVFPAANYTHVVGLNKITFTTPFNWDGVSNVIVDLNYSGIDASTNAQTYYTTTTVNTVVANHSANTGTASATRPNIIFTGPIAAPATAYSFSNGSTVVGTTNPLSITVNSNTTYTATITAAGCPFVTNAVSVNTIALPSAPTGTNSSQCGAGIPTASVASTAGGSGTGTFLWYDAPTAGNLMQGPAYGALANYYVNDFTSSALTGASVTGTAAIATGSLALTPATTSQQGGFIVNASNANSNQYQVDFDMSLTATGTDIADGMSYSFANDADATATVPAAEHGSGTKLRVCFDSYDAVSGTNGKGVYVMYNAPVSGADAYTSSSTGVLGYVPDVSWIPTSASTVTKHVTISINASGQLSVSLGGSPIISNLQLPAAFMNADKSSWKHVFSARSGGIAGGFGMDNLAIQASPVVPGYTTYQSTINNPTTFYVAEAGTNGCPSTRTPVAVTFSSNPLNATASPALISCLGQSTSLSVSQTGSTNNYTLTWSASPAGTSGLTAGQSGSLSSSVTVTPTAPGNYVYTITGADGSCISIDTVNVTVNDPFNGVTPIAIAAPSTVCAGSSTNLGVLVPTPMAVGNGSLITSNTSDVTIFGNRWPTFRMQLLYTAAELNAAGIYAGFISALSVNSLELGSGSSNTDYAVKMGPSAATSLTDYVATTGFTTVYPSANINHVVGMNTIPFSNPYNWDGTSNIIIDFSYSGLNSTYNATSTYTTTANNTVVAAHSGNTATPYNTRPDLIFSASPVITSYSWSNGSSVVGTANAIVVAPTVNTNYTATLVKGGCSAVSNTVPVTINTIPALATDGTSGSNSQPSGSSFLYTDGSCDLIAGVTTTGNSLGMVTASVTIDATVQTYNGAPYVQRHFTIVPTNNAAATVTLYATQAEFNAYNTAAGVSALHLPTTGSNSDPNIVNVKVAKYATTTPGTGGVMLTPTSVNWNAAKSWWEITVNTPGFSSFFIYAGGSIPLEIKLLDFTGVNEGKRNRLDWSTAKESTGDKFTVQRSTDGRSFSSIGTVAATGKGIYNFYDENPASGMNQYRLLLTDTKGNQDFSKTITLMVRTSSDFAVEAYPNPAKDLVNVRITGVQGNNAQLVLMDVSGRIIRQTKMAGNTATMDMHDVVDGIYMLKYMDDAHSETIKMNKQ